MFRVFIICFFLYFCLAAASTCLADTFCFRDGSGTERVSEGRLLGFDRNEFIFIDSDGFLAKVGFDDMKLLDSKDIFQVTTTTGEKVSGSVTMGGNKLQVVSASLGSLSIPMKDIQRIERRARNEPNSGVNHLPVDSRARGIAPITQGGVSERVPSNAGQGSDLAAVPEDLYLRERKVMTGRGKTELETNLTFINNDRSAPLLGPDKTRQLMVSLTGRYGLTNDLSAFLTIPFGANWRETSEEMDLTENKSNFGLGDITFGLNYQVLDESVKFPALMASLSAKANTGKTLDTYATGRDNLGSGYWELNAGLNLVRTLDPVVLFGGVNYSYVFSRTITKPDGIEAASDRVRHKPGDSVNVILGTGFSLNNRISLTFQVNGSFIFRDGYDGNEKGETRTPFYFRSGFDYAFSKTCYLEPAVAFGVTKDASDFSISLSHVYRFN